MNQHKSKHLRKLAVQAGMKKEVKDVVGAIASPHRGANPITRILTVNQIRRFKRHVLRIERQGK